MTIVAKSFAIYMLNVQVLYVTPVDTMLDITPDTAYQSFKSVMDEVFKDGVNWGLLCVECAEKGHDELVPRIADWMTTYLDEHISPWLRAQEDSFVEILDKSAAAEARRSGETLKRWLLVGVVLLTGVLIGVLVAKKQ
uniref:Bcl-2 Bcl-2 homology region 1-3 domain-containing protein n=1 Tax=Sphaeramia orbicularis TaxID=375764 RepID=A0A672Z148_9TELE